MADRNIIIEDDKGNRYFPHTKVELVQGAETPSGAQAKANTAESNAKSYAKSYTDQQVATKADIGHKHSAADITSGTISTSRLPSASTSARGVVQLTTSRTSTSNTLALAASAMNSHRTSGDHDGRYYTKAEVDALIGQSGGGGWGVPASTVLSTTESDEWFNYIPPVSSPSAIATFMVTLPGRYRITGEIEADDDVVVWISRSSSRYNSKFNLSPAVQVSSSESGYRSFTIDMDVPVAPGQTFSVYLSSRYDDDSDGYSYRYRNITLRGAEGAPPTLSARGA